MEAKARARPKLIGTLAAVVFPASLPAQAAPAKNTAFSADLGFVSTAGNTSVTTLNLGDKLVIQSTGQRVIFTQTLGIVYGETAGEKSVENYRAQVRLDYGLNGGVYLFGLTGWDRNVFGGISRRFEETVGVAWKAVRLPNDELTVEAGLSLFQQRNVVAVSGEVDDNFTAGRLGGLYKHKFTAAAFLTQGIELIPNFDDGDDWRLNSESAVVAPISTNIGVKLGYVIRYDNLPGLQPPPNPTAQRLKKTDRFFTAGLTVSY
jgi:putative salt-induced outer membrane protein